MCVELASHKLNMIYTVPQEVWHSAAGQEYRGKGRAELGDLSAQFLVPLGSEVRNNMSPNQFHPL